jgi:hypothetical protein
MGNHGSTYKAYIMTYGDGSTPRYGSFGVFSAGGGNWIDGGAATHGSMSVADSNNGVWTVANDLTTLLIHGSNKSWSYYLIVGLPKGDNAYITFS